MIEHVYRRASAARLVTGVLVATDDVRIADAVRSFGGAAVMTRSEHASGTDRIAEVAERTPFTVEAEIRDPEGDVVARARVNWLLGPVVNEGQGARDQAKVGGGVAP